LGSRRFTGYRGLVGVLHHKPEIDLGATFREVTPESAEAYARIKRELAARRERSAKFDPGAAYRKPKR
jgi:hypothetical protein